MNTVRKLSIILAGIMAATAMASCAVPDTAYSLTASAGAEKYVTLLEERLDTMPDSLVIASGDDAKSYGVDTDSFVDDEGYTIRAVDGEVIILGKTDAALDRAVRHFSNYGNNDSYTFTYGEGYKIENLTVNGNDISEYAIVRPDDADECMLYAADELAKYVKLACGVTLSAYSESEYAAAADKPARRITFKIDYPALGDEAFTIDVKADGDLDILCGRYRGALYGVYGLLHDIGWRFIADGSEYLYEADAIDLTSAINRTEEAAIPYRTASNVTKGEKNNLQMGKAGSYGVISPACHGLQSAGIDWQGLYNGGRQPCFTNEDIIQIIEDHYRNLIETRLAAGQIPGKDLCYIDVSQFDLTVFCQCVDCIDVISEEGAMSGAVLRMTNRMADMAAEYSPEIYALMLAYCGTNKPPKMTTPRDNVKIAYCFYMDRGIDICTNHSINGKECPEGTPNPTYAEEFNGWAKICKAENMQVWYYAYNCFEIAFQMACLDHAYTDMKYLIDSDISCIMLCQEYNNDQILATALSRLVWDGDMTEDEYWDMVKEYFNLYYGDAGAYMYEYTMMLQTAGDLAGCWTSFTEDPSINMVDEQYMAVNFDYMVGLFDKALRIAETEEIQNRVEILKARMLYMCITITHEDRYINGTDEERAVIAERYEELHRLFLKHKIPVFDNYAYKFWPTEEIDLELTPSYHWYQISWEELIK